MSLINDALRRATNHNQQRDPKELPPMEPTYRPIRTGSPAFSIFIVCFLLAAALTLGAWFYWKRGMTANAAAPSKPAAAAPNTNNNPIARAARTLNKVDAANKEGEAVADNIQGGAGNASSAANPAPAAASAGVGSSGGAPTQTASATGPKLQGIFYSSKNPSAIINGKAMKIGDEADGVKILAITQNSVRVQSGAEIRELTMK